MTYFLGQRICPVCPESEVNALMEKNEAGLDVCPACGYVYRQRFNSPIEQACADLIEGIGGLDDYETYEMAVMNCRREIGVAMWVIRCIGNNPDSSLAQALRERWAVKEAVK